MNAIQAESVVIANVKRRSRSMGSNAWWRSLMASPVSAAIKRRTKHGDREAPDWLNMLVASGKWANVTSVLNPSLIPEYENDLVVLAEHINGVKTGQEQIQTIDTTNTDEVEALAGALIAWVYRQRGFCHKVVSEYLAHVRNLGVK